MATTPSKLAQSLTALKELQDAGVVAIRSGQLTRTDRERLLRNGFIREVMKGWYVAAAPDEAVGESTAWYASFWGFVAGYLSHRFGQDWCLSPEQSLRLQVGDWTVPAQLLIRSPRGGNKPTPLLHGTSLFDARLALPPAGDLEIKDGLRLWRLPAALIACAPGQFASQPTVARSALAMLTDASELLGRLLAGSHSVVAGRLAGALRNIGRDVIADDVVKTMRAADFLVIESDPFDDRTSLPLPVTQRSPHVTRLRLMWQSMRPAVLDAFPAPPRKKPGTDAYLRNIDAAYLSDAYNSLSIEGYRVNAELIERVRQGNWNPRSIKADREQQDALAARGYWQSFQAVRVSVRKVLEGQPPAQVADADHGSWYRELFAPSVAAGLLPPASLAGYREGPVFIRLSKHVPPRAEAVRELMPAFFELLAQEPEPAVRVVLGHFAFVYIHPYADGNGRMGRFLMNLMLAAGGYPWLVIPRAARDAYMAALESASVDGDIRPFAGFLHQCQALVHQQV